MANRKGKKDSKEQKQSKLEGVKKAKAPPKRKARVPKRTENAKVSAVKKKEVTKKVQPKPKSAQNPKPKSAQNPKPSKSRKRENTPDAEAAVLEPCLKKFRPEEDGDALASGTSDEKIEISESDDQKLETPSEVLPTPDQEPKRDKTYVPVVLEIRESKLRQREVDEVEIIEPMSKKFRHENTDAALDGNETNEMAELSLPDPDMFWDSDQESELYVPASGQFEVLRQFLLRWIEESESSDESSDDEQDPYESAMQQIQEVQQEIRQRDVTVPDHELVASDKKIEVVVSECEDAKEKKDEKIRCATCKRKLGLTAIQCRCGGFYCAKHRYSNEHDCTFDYRELGREEIRRNNPLVKSKKIEDL